MHRKAGSQDRVLGERREGEGKSHTYALDPAFIESNRFCWSQLGNQVTSIDL